MKKEIRVVVVGVASKDDGAPGTSQPREDPALAPAAALAERLGARLHVVSAFDRPDPVRNTCAPALDDGASVPYRKSQIERVLRAQTRRFPNAERICCHAVEGRADLQLCAFAEEVDADLLIIGATRCGEGRHNQLGHNTEQVLRRAPIPVLVVRRPFAQPVRRVLLTTDLSELAPAIHEVALETLEAGFDHDLLEARELLVCDYSPAIAARMSREFTTHAAMSRLRQFLAEGLHRRLPVLPCIRIGNPSTEILGEADEWNADLLVLGSHCEGGLARLLLGTTASATLQGSDRNALVIPAAVAATWQHRRARNRWQRTPDVGFPGKAGPADARPALATA